MKKIKFEKLYIRNFLSVGDTGMIFPFKKGIHAITGKNLDKDDDNGVGKSLIPDALYFCLFGETIRELKKDEIVNDIYEKNCQTALTFKIDYNGTETEYKIERGISPSFCKVYVGGKEETLSTIPASNEFIRNLISSSPMVIRNTVTMSLNSTIPFMAQKKNEKREFVEGIFRLELFKAMNDSAKDSFGNLVKDYEATANLLIECENNIKIYGEKSKLFDINQKEKVKELNGRKIAFEKQLQDLRDALLIIDADKYDKIKKDLESNKIKNTAANLEKNLIFVRLETNRQNVLKNNRLLANLNETLSHLKTSYSECKQVIDLSGCKTPEENIAKFKEVETESTKKANTLLAEKVGHIHKIKVNKQDIETIAKFGSFCSECKRPFPDSDVKQNNEKIAALTKENEELEEVINNLATQQNELGDLFTKAGTGIKLIERVREKKLLVEEVDKGKKEIETDTTKEKEMVDKLATLLQEKEELETAKAIQDDYIKKNLTTTSSITLISEFHSKTVKDLNEASTQINEFDGLHKLEITKKEELDKKITEYKEKIAMYDVIKFLVSEEGIKSHIINKLLAILNERIDYYLKILNSNCKLKFDQYFEDTIVNDRGIEKSYFNFSGGERKRIDLACMFSFMDIRRIQGDVSFNLCFYDELLDSALSSQISEKLFKDILKERLNKYDESTYVITHKKENLKSELINDIILLEKSGGLTKLL